MMTKGIFITVEGPDGAGKSTHLGHLEDKLASAGFDVVVTREPGGTGLGEKLRKLLLQGSAVEISDNSELLLMFAARMQHIEEVIRPALIDRKCVLCDRFTDATFAYQGGGRGIDAARIEDLQNWVQQGLDPDLTFLLDVPVPIGLSRVRSRGAGNDRFEQQALEFKEAVRQSYLDRAVRYPQRIRVIDASQSIAEVQSRLDQELSRFLEQNRNPV
jgi:dTMP kinase